MWMTSCTGSTHGGFWAFWRKSVSWVEFCLGRRRLTFTCSPWPCVECHTCCGGGGRWKSQHRKIVHLSPYVEKPLNSKVIKSFVPELRSRKCFSCFGIPMFYVYMLRTFYVRFAYPYHGYVTAITLYEVSGVYSTWEQTFRWYNIQKKVMIMAKQKGNISYDKIEF